MLQFSHDEVIFQRETVAHFTISNNHPRPIIYKVKTTSTTAIEINNTQGFIEPWNSLNLPIKSNTPAPF